MTYSQSELGYIIADSLEGFTYKQKACFLAAVCGKRGEHIKYEQILIKSVGGGVYNKMRALFSSEAYRAQILERLDARGIVCVTPESAEYPERLANIPAPPHVLYCRGRTSLLKGEFLGIVGSRRTPASTLAACKKFAGEISRVMTVVTGVADGADSAAVKGGQESGNIICVLPGGMDHIYPSSNSSLLKSVEERGLIISEWQPHIAVQRYMFTVRNRIIAGLSRGVLVVSAPKKSGALITANYAADFGREVFAFPHSLGISAGEGCNELIKNGAALCTNPLDILGAFGLEYKAEQQPLTPGERKVLCFLKDNGCSHVQAVAAGVGVMAFEAVTLLSSLEIKGLVARCGGNNYEAV